MKHIITIMAIAIASLLTASCTHNDGDIGDWFGQWKLMSVTVDGVEDTSYEGNIFFCFQSSVFNQLVIYDNHFTDNMFARWEDNGEYITINFPIERYHPHPVTRMTMGQNILRVDSKSGGKMRLSITTAEGNTVVYSLKKW